MTKLAIDWKATSLYLGGWGGGIFYCWSSVCVCVFIYTLIYFLSMQAFYCCVWFICTNTWPDLFFTFVFIYEGIQSLSTKHPLSFKRQSLTLTSSMFKDFTLKISIKKFIVISSLKKNFFIKHIVTLKFFVLYIEFRHELVANIIWFFHIRHACLSFFVYYTNCCFCSSEEASDSDVPSSSTITLAARSNPYNQHIEASSNLHLAGIAAQKRHMR